MAVKRWTDEDALFAKPGVAGNWLSLDLRSQSMNTRAVGARIAIDVERGWAVLRYAPANPGARREITSAAA